MRADTKSSTDAHESRPLVASIHERFHVKRSADLLLLDFGAAGGRRVIHGSTETVRSGRTGIFARVRMFREPWSGSGRKPSCITGSVVGFTASIGDHGDEGHPEERHPEERCPEERHPEERCPQERPGQERHRFEERRCDHEYERHFSKASSTVRFLHLLHDHIRHLLHDHIRCLDIDVIGTGITTRCRWHLLCA